MARRHESGKTMALIRAQQLFKTYRAGEVDVPAVKGVIQVRYYF
jgi:hypothetical protein